jgi:hypothetical protein
MGDAHEPGSGCPVNAAIEVSGDRWSPLVLRDIVFADRRYFRELQAGSQEGIASPILVGRLKRLLESGCLFGSQSLCTWVPEMTPNCTRWAQGGGQARQSTQTICRNPDPSGSVTGTYPNLIRCVVPGTDRQDGHPPMCVSPWPSTQVTLPTPSNPYA